MTKQDPFYCNKNVLWTHLLSMNHCCPNIANVASTNLQTHINCLFAFYRYRLPELLVGALPSLNHNQCL